ncbi:hypothetical protein FRB96_008540 [Tulasnella sp. 330]|nr:hypothetical protein FRB96_008540 [Tulasnella sp. 330]KAG8870099.1 hypothetical protein FRB98_001867 [Tulasnella sp. 332]
MGKYLASSDKAIRDKAFNSLRLFLSSRGGDLLDDKEMIKLWKGLFFCFWHSDKPLVQQALATDLAGLTLTINSTPTSFQFLKGFWQMMVEQWTKIDHLRLDKFYMLIRRFINASFRFLIKLDWEENYMELYDLMLTGPGGPLFPDDQRIPTSLACHMSDVYLEELEKAINDSEPTPETIPILDLLYPFMTYSSQISVNSAYKRVMESILDPFLSATTNTVTSDQEPHPKRVKRSSSSTFIPSPDYSAIISRANLRCIHKSIKPETLVVVATPDELRVAFLKTLFDVASLPDARDVNRKKMYAFWKAAMADGVDTTWDPDAS